MAIKKVLRYGDPILRTPSKEVHKVSKKVQELVNDLIDTMYAQNGVGLAAPQVGESVQMAALLVPDDEGKIIFKEIYVNPEIISESVRQACLSEGEGCLSVDEVINGYVPRPDKLTIHYYTVDGEEKTIRLKDYPAIVSSHEIDHLNGHLFYDRIKKQKPYALKEDTVVIS